MAEKLVQAYLSGWSSRSPRREFNRLVDTKAAGRIIKAAVADFEWFCADNKLPLHGLIEVKETKHEYRLARDRITQMPRLRKRSAAGGKCLILIYHSTLDAWRCADAVTLFQSDEAASWDLRSEPTFTSPGTALASLVGVFA